MTSMSLDDNMRENILPHEYNKNNAFTMSLIISISHIHEVNDYNMCYEINYSRTRHIHSKFLTY